MAVADVHPSIEELTAFTLGTLDDETQASVEAHVAACTACQERAAVAPADNLVELVRRVRARTGRGSDTFVETAGHVETPVPLAPLAESVTLGSAVAPSTPAESDRLEVPDAIPAELTRHERYRVVRLLGAGGMGAVYEAEHLVMQRPVALKVIRRALTAKADAVERFRREVRAAARLSHPNIVATTDAEDAGETHFLVMEYVEGTDLGRLVQERGPLPVDRACDYIRQAALGLQYAFERGMVHRDLKPHNLMLTPDGRVKILDFGLARFASEAASAAGVTGTGMVLGTVDYMAPEQADSARQADIRSDIYSLGCTLYHLLAGQPPFPTGTPLQKVMAHREKKPQPLTELRPDLPEGFMPVLERMMAKNPRPRYQTPAAAALALEAFVLEKTPVRDRRRPWLVIATAVLAILVAGLLGVAVYRIATDKGELVIQTNNNDVEVVIRQGGEEVKIVDTKTGKHFTLNSGDYELVLKGGQEGLKISPDKMTLKRGETVLATITRAGKPSGALPGPPPAAKPLAGLVAWWRADGNAKDSVGGNHGTLKGGVTFAPGIAGKAFDFNGKDAYIQIPNNANLNPGAAFSVEFWVKANPSQPEDHFLVVDKSHGFVDATGWSFEGLTATGELGFGTYPAPGVSTGVSILDNQWHHIAGVFTGDSTQMYLDGLLRCMTPFKAKALLANNTRDLYFGRGYTRTTRHFNGLLDEVCIYDRALRAEEVKARWSALAPSTKPVAKNAEQVGEVRRFVGHTDVVWGVALSPNGRYALSTSADSTIRLWDLQTGIEIRSYRAGVNSVAFLPDGREFLSGGDRMRHWQLETGTQLHSADHPSQYDVAVSPNGRLALAAHEDSTLHLWDLKNWRAIRRFEGHTSQKVQRVVFSADGRRALSGGWDKTARLWDVESGTQLKCFMPHQDYVMGVALSPDGRLALSGSGSPGGDGELILWDIATEKELRRFKGHRGRVSGVAFSPDGRFALSGADDRGVRMWEVATGKELHRFDGHEAAVYSVVFSRDGRYALSGSHDKTVRLWRLPDPPPAKKNP
jgi:serine/threonine protein kinase